MSLFLNLRAGSYGAVCTPFVIDSDVDADPPVVTPIATDDFSRAAHGKDVLLATHGFNVSYDNGLRSLGRLADRLAPRPSELVVGVLWPGDFAIPAINYPFEDKVAAHAGQLLGDFCNRRLAGAQSLSFASHSLGARVVLEAVAALDRRARCLCVTAGAIGADCLTDRYPNTVARCDTVVTLSSMEDLVLELAFPVGDIIADILDLDHKPFQRALGRQGPQTPYPHPPITAAQIANKPPYNHGDYLPPGGSAAPVMKPQPLWPKATDFIGRAFRGQAQSWPV